MSLSIVVSLRKTVVRRSPELLPGACLAASVVLVCIMDFSQLVLAVLGALMYAAMNVPAAGTKRPSSKGQPLKSGYSCAASAPKVNFAGKSMRKDANMGKSSPVARVAAKGAREPVHDHGEVRQTSWNAVIPVQFTAVGWDAEVEELTSKILPSARSKDIVQDLAKRVRQELSTVFPGAEVMGFTFSDLMRQTAFGVAVPEVDIIVCLKPHLVNNRWLDRSSMSSEQYNNKFKKIAIRTCTEHLVNHGGLKFRRSAFRGQEPKVTLLVPAALGIHSDSIPIDFSVNSTTPMHHAALLTECGHLDPRAQALVLLVKRWAKDRGVCFAAKGHLSPYAWMLMTMYFLQVGIQEEDPVLPSVEKFEAFSTLAKRPAATSSTGAAELPEPLSGQAREGVVPSIGAAGKKSVGKLLCEFFRFYAQEFNFSGEAICVRQGKRSAPNTSLPLHIVVHADGVSTDVAPSIEDPFDQKRNVSNNMSWLGTSRLRDELSRADKLCSAPGTSLSELLEPWAPLPEKAGEMQVDTSE